MGEDIRVIKTKNSIRDALYELMSEKELAKITISEICVRARINRKTFYSHYRAPADVIEELENEVLGEFSAIIRRSGESLLNIGTAIRDISATIEQRRDFFKRLLRLNPDLFSNGKIKAMLCRLITVSLKNAGVLSDNETALCAAAEFSVSGVLSLYSMWFDNNCADKLSFITNTAVDMVTRGLSAYVSEEKLQKMKLALKR